MEQSEEFVKKTGIKRKRKLSTANQENPRPVKQSRKILPKFDLYLLPDEIILHIVGLNLEKGLDLGVTFFKKYEIFTSLLRTCKRFNKFLDQPQMWVNMALYYKGDSTYLGETDTRAMVLPFLENVEIEKARYGKSFWYKIPREIKVKELTPELLEIIPHLKKMLRSRFSQQKQSILSAKLKKFYFAKYVNHTRYPVVVL